MFKILDYKGFRQHVEIGASILQLNQDLDSASVILEILGTLASGQLLAPRLLRLKKPKAATEEQFDDLWDGFIKKSSHLSTEKGLEIIREARNQVENLKLGAVKDLENIEEVADPKKFAPYLAVPDAMWMKLSKLSIFGQLLPLLLFCLFTTIASLRGKE